MRCALAILKYVLAVLFGMLVAAWVVGQEKPDTPSVADYDVMEAAIRELLPTLKNDSVAFILLDWKDDEVADPPEEFLRRFADAKIRIAPASQSRFPTKEERISGSNRGIEDSKTGKPANVFYARVVQRHSIDKVEVIASRNRGTLDANGYRAIFERRGGRWILTKRIKSWIS